MPGPLEGIKILELIRVAPGAFCTMMLADMGAVVLKIETPQQTRLRFLQRKRLMKPGVLLFSLSTVISRA